LSHHAHVLILLAKSPDETIADLATKAGVTPRSVSSILRDLEESRYISRTRLGRRNHYNINPEGPLRHPTSAHRTVGQLITTLGAME
jgi:DNA-binding MarR family transcriptional regulator